LKEENKSPPPWEEILDLLDKYQFSADDVISLAEDLYDMAHDYLEEIHEDKDKEKEAPVEKAKRIARLANIRSPFLDRFPLSKDRWGLDPSLIYEEH